jgi:hypothetical protein
VLSVFFVAALKLTLRLELGPEYDTNANRAEVIAGTPAQDGGPPIGSALLRTTARGALTLRTGINQLRIDAGLGAKIFFNPDVFDQNVVVLQAGVEDRVRLSRRFLLGFQSDYYDAFQPDIPSSCENKDCARERDFRSGSLRARLTLLEDVGDVTVTGGYHGYQYKGFSDYNFQAASAGIFATSRAHVGAAEDPTELTFSAAYGFEKRYFTGYVEQLADWSTCMPEIARTPGALVACGAQRTDWFHEASFEATYLKRFLVSAGYALQLNESNSFGYSLLRHLISLKVSFRLPWQIYVTLKGQLQFTTFLDPVLLFANVNNATFEDENRNMALADLERPIGKAGLALNARYTVYTSELGSNQAEYLRMVIFLGLTYRTATR